MAYRKSEIGMLAQSHPERARKSLLSAFRRSKGDALKAAEALGITRRTFDRLVRALGLLEEIERERAEGRAS